MRAYRRSVEVGLILVMAVGATVGVAGPARAAPIVCVDTADYDAAAAAVCVDTASGHVHGTLQTAPWLVDDPIETVYLELNADGEHEEATVTSFGGYRIGVTASTGSEMGQRYVTVCLEPTGECITAR